MRRRSRATAWAATLFASLAVTLSLLSSSHAADLIWEVENPFRFFKPTKSFALHEAAFTAVTRSRAAGVLIVGGPVFFRERVQIADEAFQPFFEHMGIDLRGRNVGVAEECLHHAQIRTVMQQVAGKGVAQYVRA